MKSSLFSLTVAALLCCVPFTASARDTGRKVVAQFDSTESSKFSFEPVKLANAAPLDFGKKGPESVEQNECSWQVLNIPVRVGAMAKEGASSRGGKMKEYPNYLPSITFTVYVLIDRSRNKLIDAKSGRTLDRKSSSFVLEKKVTYVNIPLEKSVGGKYVGSHQVDAIATMQVAVFLSPYDIREILSNPDNEYENPKYSKTAPKIDIAAVYMKAEYNGALCWAKDKTAKADELDVKVASDAKQWVPEKWKWWMPKQKTTLKAQMHSINETPFAAYYYPHYYPTQPLFGSATSSIPTADSVSPTSTSALGDSQETTAADAAGDTTAGDATATDTTATDTPAPSGRKTRKGKSSRN